MKDKDNLSIWGRQAKRVVQSSVDVKVMRVGGVFLLLGGFLVFLGSDEASWGEGFATAIFLTLSMHAFQVSGFLELIDKKDKGVEPEVRADLT